MTTVIGLVAVIACVIIGIMWGGGIASIVMFWDASSVFITIGGAMFTMLIGYPVKDIIDMFKACGAAMRFKDIDPTENIEQIIDLANVARRDGLLALENMLEDIRSPFLRKGIMLIVDGSNSELVKSVMETEIYYMSGRHARICAMLSQGATYAPAYGMIGTLIGLIQMLMNLSDMNSLGPSMSVALVTTFYGVLLANGFFTPFSKKLATMSDAEGMQCDMMLEGILSIQDGENPRMIRDKLEAFISQKQIEQLEMRMNASKEAAQSEAGAGQ